jgi:hypothetical protein
MAILFLFGSGRSIKNYDFLFPSSDRANLHQYCISVLALPQTIKAAGFATRLRR